MIGPAPQNIWDQVVREFARLWFEREMQLGKFGDKMPHLIGKTGPQLGVSLAPVDAEPPAA